MKEEVKKVPQNIACPIHIWPVYCDWQIITESGKTRKKKLIFGTWNICTLLARENVARPEGMTALLAKKNCNAVILILQHLMRPNWLMKDHLKRQEVTTHSSGKGSLNLKTEYMELDLQIRTAVLKNIPTLPSGVNECLTKLHISLSISIGALP